MVEVVFYLIKFRTCDHSYVETKEILPLNHMIDNLCILSQISLVITSISVKQ